MHRFKPHWSTFTSLRKTSGSNTLARLPGTSGQFRRCDHETKTSPAPHSSSDEVLRASGRICDDFAGGCLRHFLSLYGPALPDLSRRSVSCGSVTRSTPPRSAYPRLAGSVAVANPATGHDYTRQLCHLPALHAGRTSLTPEQDQLIQQELLRRNDLFSNVLLLLRHTGMRIGECVDLSVDCLRTIEPNQWAIHVPLGKLKTERWVPVDSMVCQLVERIRSLRPPTAPETGRLLLSRKRGRFMLIRTLRATLQDVIAAAGITARIVPHQFR